MAAVLRDQPKPPSEIVPDLPKELERIILRCLRKEPERRFQHMTDLKVELQEVKEENDSRAAAAGAGEKRRPWRVVWIVAAALVLIVAWAATWQLRRRELPPHLVQVSPARYAVRASFSPDGNQVVFGSRGDQGNTWNIWLKIVGEAESRRLTAGPGGDLGPEWSPDGKQIAFVRKPPDGPRNVYLMSPLGGAERRLLDFPIAGAMLSWSPDGHWLAVEKARVPGETSSGSGGIYLIPVEGGEPRPVTFPKPPAYDGSPAFSPDGRALAYATCETDQWDPACDVWALPLGSEARPRGEARRLTRERLWIVGLTWTRDGRSIVWGSGVEGDGLWRVRSDGSAPPGRIGPAGALASMPSAGRGQDRLAFVRYSQDGVIYRLELGGSAVPLIDSTSRDINAQYSPDGRRIAFASRRSGARNEIWLVDADGANPTRLTRGPGRFAGSPRWSPDGRTIAFDSRSQAGEWEVWTIGVDGLGVHQVTHNASAHSPSFSRDGRWIYFCTRRTGRDEVWRVAASGGPEEQVTHEGGSIPLESFDGRTLYYLRSVGGALLARPTGGGAERTVVPCVNGWGYAVGRQGIFHVDCSAPDAASLSQRALRYWDAATGGDQVVGRLEAPMTYGLSVSPDGRRVLYDRTTQGYDLLMIDNFR